jgi:hypothetical protein
MSFAIVFFCLLVTAIPIDRLVLRQGVRRQHTNHKYSRTFSLFLGNKTVLRESIKHRRICPFLFQSVVFRLVGAALARKERVCADIFYRRVAENNRRLL